MKKIILTVVLLLAVVPTPKAQEYIKEVEDITSTFSIIREYRKDVRIVYSKNADYRGFLWVSENGLTAPILDLTSDAYVYDFEILNDTLYFCGAVYDYNIQDFVGLMGCFDLLLFPTPILKTYWLHDFARLERMEMLQSYHGGPLQIVMTGYRFQGNPCIVDAIQQSYPTSWAFYHSASDSAGFVYDDVAVTSKHVVVATRSTNDKKGIIYYFDHPYSGNHIFYGMFYCVKMDTNITSRIILEAREGECFSSVCRKDDLFNNPVLDVINYTTTNIIHDHLVIIPASNDQIPRDLKYSRHDRELDLLTNLTKDGCLGSIVYHIDTIVHVNGRYYYNQPIYSLEYLNLDQHHFMASGSDVKKNLRIYKYTPLREPFCAELYNPTYYDFPMYGSAYPKTLGFVNVEEPMTHTEHRDLENPIKIKCYYDMKTSYKEE